MVVKDKFYEEKDLSIQYFIDLLSSELYALAVKIREDKGKYIKQRTIDFDRIKNLERQIAYLINLL